VCHRDRNSINPRGAAACGSRRQLRAAHHGRERLHERLGCAAVCATKLERRHETRREVDLTNLLLDGTNTVVISVHNIDPGPGLWRLEHQIRVRDANGLPVANVTEFRAGAPRTLFAGRYVVSFPIRMYDVTPDGKRFLMVQDVERQPMKPTHIILVQNWFEELKRRVPTK
jgi:hypothetical protein